MSGNGSSPETAPGEALVKTRRAQEKTEIERRRALVARFRFVQGLTETQIVERLARLDPPIVVTHPTVSRDIQIARTRFRSYYNAKGFDAANEVAKALARYEHVALRALRLATRKATKKDDGRGIAALFRVHNDATNRYTNLLQDVGLLDRKLGTLFLDDGRDAKALPSGTELARRFEGVKVLDGEVVSEAENAWMYGDAAAAETAARAATDTAAENAEKDGK